MVHVILYGTPYILLRVFIWLRWWRWRVEGLENLPPRSVGGMIIAPNHVHWLDILVLGALMPFAYRLTWLGKAELFEKPFYNWLFRSLQVIPIQRGKRDMSALGAAEEALQTGGVLVVFPEGHRSRTGILQKGRSGAIRLAARTGVPIVPVSVVGTEYGLKGALARREVLVRIGEPYRLEVPEDGRMPPEQMHTAIHDLMQRIAALLPHENRGVYA